MLETMLEKVVSFFVLAWKIKCKSLRNNSVILHITSLILFKVIRKYARFVL